MVPEKTPNLKLKKPDYENGVADIRIFNENWDILDEANKKIENEMTETNDKIDNGLKTKLDKGSYEGNADDLKREIDGKEPAFSKKSGFNLNKTDSYEEDDTNKVGTARALKRLYDWIRNKLANLTLSWDRITNKPNLMTSENVQTLLKNKVDKAGDTMTGTLNSQAREAFVGVDEHGNRKFEIGYDKSEDRFFIYDNVHQKIIMYATNGQTVIPSEYLQTTAKEVIGAINENKLKRDALTGKYYNNFPLSSANVDDIFYHSATNKYYICVRNYSGAQINNPNSNFEDLSVYENRKKLDSLITLKNGGKLKIKFTHVTVKAGTFQTVLTPSDLGIQGNIHGAVAVTESIDVSVSPNILCAVNGGKLEVKLYYINDLYLVKQNFGAFVAVFYY